MKKEERKMNMKNEKRKKRKKPCCCLSFRGFLKFFSIYLSLTISFTFQVQDADCNKLAAMPASHKAVDGQLLTYSIGTISPCWFLSICSLVTGFWWTFILSFLRLHLCLKSFPVQPPTNYLNFTDFRQRVLTLTHYKYNLQWKENFASRRKKETIVKNSQILHGLWAESFTEVFPI